VVRGAVEAVCKSADLLDEKVDRFGTAVADPPGSDEIST
jgi:hypothetical protein